ncbi:MULTISPECIES: RNA polymerase sigma factor FliA [unclassified Oleiphilus]|uniref:RNA polymerase sigma factor FliA n=1 Tax=unclassified Oleiphilus TaxID=2631174 RepID=UPI0007C32213|nr:MULTISPECIES: RNA polymerase sigma factor FliA [unclassified Oleiphilus]KZZ31406.1 RNA polymerase sigma factor FliA [Oleiphilus sp. HI0086]KZZ35552.1 RNA polymerase sigma factor FliA [Oleiphilus sp. HI0117]KZZ56745.1 RNA polymerase sigma factor FliA [Oleiphilus sp. HI0123]
MYTDAQVKRADDLIRSHAPLVKKIAHHLISRLPSSVQVDDLIQAGMIGLLEASRKYEASKGASFETYAGIRIRGSMMDEVRRGDWVPRSVHRNARKISEAIKAIEDREGRDAQDGEVASELGMTLEEYFACLKDSASGKLFSFEELSESGDVSSEEYLSENYTPATDVQNDAFRRALAKEIDVLPEREKMVLSLYYEEELNLKEIGLVLSVSESRVSQIHSQAAMRLKARMSDWRT